MGDKPKPKKVLKDRSAFKKLEPYSPPQAMMPMMPMGMPMPQMPMPQMPKKMPAASAAAAPAAAAGKSAVAVKSSGALTTLTDKSVIEAKIKDIAVQIIGDDDGVDA